jgi:uncharacterized repeat protein (TIGR01451 family)
VKGEDIMNMKNKLIICCTLVLFALTATALISGTVGAKSLYLVPNHNNQQFDAWNINPDGSMTYQATYGLSYATDPAGMAIDESSNTLFITTEFSSYSTTFEIVDANTMTNIGVINDGADFAGIAVDDQNDIIYTAKRMNTDSDDLYAYDWDPSASTATLRAGFPINLPNLNQAMGIALDEPRGILWVADSGAGIARAYDTATWTEDLSKSFAPVHKPVGIAVDSLRNFVYTVSMNAGASTPPGCGSLILSKYDVATSTETTGSLIDQGVGVAVNEVTGYVYVTISPYGAGQPCVQAWDTSTNPFTQVESKLIPGGSPAGITIPREEVSFNPLNLTKDDGLEEGACVSPGDHIYYEICFDNLNTNNGGINNVVLNDTLPPEVDFISASEPGVYNPVDHTVNFDVGTLSKGHPQICYTIEVEVKSGTAPGTLIVNTATIDGDEVPPTSISEVTEVCDTTDNTPPVTIKTVGNPKYGPNDEWVRNTTIFNMTATDDDSGVAATYLRIWYQGVWTPLPGTGVGKNNNFMVYLGNFTLSGNCKHYIEFYSEDNVGNKEATQNQTHYVDEMAPTTDPYPPEFGSPHTTTWYGGQEYVMINCSTPMWINVTDPTCGIGVWKMTYSIWYNPTSPSTYVKIPGSEKEVFDGDPDDLDPDFGEISVAITFDEECFHEVRWTVTDLFGHTAMYDYDFAVDCTPPEITKFIGDPECDGYGTYVSWVNFSTPFVFNATDAGCNGGAGVAKIGYEIRILDRNTVPPSWVIIRTEEIDDDSNEDEWGETYGEIQNITHMTEECEHEISFWAMDYVGNKVEYKQKHLVDNTPPEIIKTVGVPKCVIIPGEEYCVNLSTVISFHAVDHGCLGGVGLVEMRYNVWNEEQGWSGWTYDEGLDGETYQFQEECKHYLVIEAWDCLGNKNVDNETFWVDEQPPFIEKIVGEPKFPIQIVAPTGQFAFIGDDDDDVDIYNWWINCLTPITINATDMGCCGNLTYLAYQINDSGWVDITNDPKPVTIYLPECVHYLNITAEDCLGNTANHNEIFYVDCTPPKINKTVGTPNCEIIPGKEYCITTGTIIDVSSVDEGCMGGIGLKNLSFRTWNMSQGWSKWTAACGNSMCIRFYEECKHYLEIFAEDYLGNSIADNETFWVDDQPPNITKNVGDPNIPGTFYWAMNTEETCPTCGWGSSSKQVYFPANWGRWTHVNCYKDNTKASPQSWDETDFNTDKYFDVDMTREIIGTNVIWTVDISDIGSPTEGPAVQLVIANESSPMFMVGVNSHESTTPFYKPYNSGWGSIQSLPDGITMVGNNRDTHFVITIPIYYLTNDYWINCSTQITIDASDMGCCGRLTNLSYRVNGGKWNDIFGQNPYPLTFGQCVHKLDIFAEDCLGNNAYHNETFWVDCTPPKMTKTVDIPNCPVEIDGEPTGDYYVTTDTLICFSFEDEGCQGGVGLKNVSYRIWNMTHGWGPWMYDDELEGVCIQFEEECIHHLWIEATDKLGNKFVDNETFYVDDTPPDTVKTFKGPTYDNDYWLRDNDTWVILNTSDPGICASGAVFLHVELWWASNGNDIDTLLWSIDINDNDANDSDDREGKIQYKFQIMEDCLHEIRWYSVDCLGNIEKDTEQIVNLFFDDFESGLDKWTIAYDKYWDHWSHQWIYDPLVTIEDDDPSPAGGCYAEIETIDEWKGQIGWMSTVVNTTGFYDIKLSYWAKTRKMNYGDYLYAMYRTDPSDDFTEIASHKLSNWVYFNYPLPGADNQPYLEIMFYVNCDNDYGMIDNVLITGNTTIHMQQHRVDSVPPEIIKIVGEPSFSDDGVTWWVTDLTPINVTAIDHEDPCAVGVKEILYRIWWRGKWSEWYNYTGNFTFEEGCTHYLEIKAIDHLGNFAVDNETFIVHGPTGDSDPNVAILDPPFIPPMTISESSYTVIIEATDDLTDWEDLQVFLMQPGGRRDAPDIWYDVTLGSTEDQFEAVIDDLYKYQDGAKITLQAYALDEDGNVGVAIPVTFTVHSTTVWDQWMQEGWNLLQLPYNVGCNETVDRILKSIEGDYDYVFHYDILSDTWFSYSPDIEPQYNDLTMMEGGKQYWVHMTNGDGIRYYLGLPEIEIEYPADGAVIEISEIADFISGNAWDSQGGIDKVEIQLYFKDGSNNKHYWNGTDWADSPVNLGCLFGEPSWGCPTGSISWIPGQTYYVKAMAFDAFGCYATDMASFEFISYTISGTVFLDPGLTVETGSTLVVGVGNFSSWASFPYVDVVGLTNFTDPAFPLDYSFDVFNGSYFVIAGLVNQTSTDAAYAIGASFNVTMDPFIPDEIIVAGADIEDADLTLMEMIEEEPV